MSIRAHRILFLGSLMAVALFALAYIPHGRLVTVSQRGGCYLSGPSGTLVKDPTYYTAFTAGDGAGLPVAWPKGYSARLAGSEVEVLGTDGTVVATTGRKGYILPLSEPPLPPGFNGVAICGFVSY